MLVAYSLGHVRFNVKNLKLCNLKHLRDNINVCVPGSFLYVLT